MALLLLTGCGGSSGDAPSAAGSGNGSGTGSGSGGNAGGNGGSSSFTVGGTITGLGAAAGLVLANGSDTLSVPAGATSFTMTVLHSFAGGTTDGATGGETLLQASDGTLYGVTYSGGASGKGTVFEIN